MALTSKRWLLSQAKMLEFLIKLVATPVDNALTIYLPPGLPTDEIEKSLRGLLAQDVTSELAGLMVNSRNGSVLFWSTEARYLVLPPFPTLEKYLFAGFDVERLRSLLERDYRIAFILVRLGSYAIGVSYGKNLVSSKVGTGLVHGRHRQGGSSAHRFERHRDKQIEYFLSRVCQHAREQLEPHVKTLDYLVYGGAWTTIELLLKQCDFLGRFDTPNLPPLLEIPDPRQAVLESALKRVWSSTVIEFY